MAEAPLAVEDSDVNSTDLWLDALFGRRKGYVYAPVGVGGFVNGKGSYDHQRWEGGHFFRWPGERADVIAHVRERTRADDVYVAPRLRTGRNANAGSAHDGRWLFADLDAEPTQQQRRLIRELVARGHMLVQSGSAGHHHLYLELDRIYPIEQLTVLNRRLALALGADSKWQDNTVLRPTGTLNHKGAASGATSTRVSLLSDSQRRTWTATQLDGLLPALGVQSVALASADSNVDWDGTLPDNFSELMSQGAYAGGRAGQREHPSAARCGHLDAAVRGRQRPAGAKPTRPTRDAEETARRLRRLSRYARLLTMSHKQEPLLAYLLRTLCRWCSPHAPHML